MSLFFAIAIATFLVTGLLWRKYLQKISGGGVTYALSPHVASASLHQVMLALVALVAVRQLYIVALGIPAPPANLPAALVFFIGLAMLSYQSVAKLPVKPHQAKHRS